MNLAVGARGHACCRPVPGAPRCAAGAPCAEGAARLRWRPRRGLSEFAGQSCGGDGPGRRADGCRRRPVGAAA
eukprot:CAMPEP_0168477734 /NCGR_PEP_ID=MMETSP0228-20121227/62571_1 /TAXON_ID=133427 /ORGANISM="Protoceratium reticulatum, Strain CCCM 535 (=CCMP 1889)" /LENGTH=72 /DNA_ID=CAMNT_0008493925 /DNA_START=10 /DNA_END=224 /DNA_ORIENTATION=-